MQILNYHFRADFQIALKLFWRSHLPVTLFKFRIDAIPDKKMVSCAKINVMPAGCNAGHLGTGILAPEGTHILAAHSGTVLVSGWNDSYGNQVLLDNGASLSTRYVHMTQTAVTAGEAVTAGQVIGYVGNTGDSTGNHLHFEVLHGGVWVDPLSLAS